MSSCSSTSDIDSDDANHDDETGKETVHLGLHLILMMRHLLIKAQFSQIQHHGDEEDVQFAHKCTQTQEAWPRAIEHQQPCIVHQQTYTRNEVRSAVNHERVKGRLRGEISVLKERCVMLEKMCADSGFFVLSKS